MSNLQRLNRSKDIERHSMDLMNNLLAEQESDDTAKDSTSEESKKKGKKSDA